MAVYTKVEVGVPKIQGRLMPTAPPLWATAVVFEAMHEMHLQVPGFRAVRDQSASIATGSWFHVRWTRRRDWL